MPETIVSVANGLGSQVTATYDRLNKNGALYTKGTSSAYPQRDLDGAFYVVSKLDADNGIGGVYTHTYSYGGAIADASLSTSQGGFAGLIGFSTVAESDPQTGTIVMANYRTDRPFAGLIASRTVTRGALTLSSASYTYAAVTTFGIAHAVELTESVVAHKDVTGTADPSVTMDYTYDAYANPLTVHTSVSDGSSELVTNTFSNDTTNWGTRPDRHDERPTHRRHFKPHAALRRDAGHRGRGHARPRHRYRARAPAPARWSSTPCSLTTRSATG